MMTDFLLAVANLVIIANNCYHSNFITLFLADIGKKTVSLQMKLRLFMPIKTKADGIFICKGIC